MFMYIKFGNKPQQYKKPTPVMQLTIKQFDKCIIILTHL